MITGQVIFREAGQHSNGKHLMMFIGIVAIPEGVVKGEHQYTLCGSGDQNYPVTNLLLLTDSGKDMSVETQGAGFGHLVKMPIWRV